MCVSTDWTPSDAIVSSARGRVVAPSFSLSVSDLDFGVVAFGE